MSVLNFTDRTKDCTFKELLYNDVFVTYSNNKLDKSYLCIKLRPFYFDGELNITKLYSKNALRICLDGHVEPIYVHDDVRVKLYNIVNIEATEVV